MKVNPTCVFFLSVGLNLFAAGNTDEPNSTGGAPVAHPNVLMIVIDDLNDWVGYLGGHPQAKTPCMDALAASGTAFANAHAQAPLCNPSRTSCPQRPAPFDHRHLRPPA